MIPLYTYPARPHNGGPFKGIDHLPYLPEDYSYTPKYNGWAQLIHVPTRTVFNRHGQVMSIRSEFKPALDQLCLVLDAGAFKWVHAEGLERRHGIGKGSIIVLDVVPEFATRNTTYEERMSWISIHSLPVLPIDQKPEANAIYRPPVFSAGELEHNWQLMQDINKQWGCQFYEGVVAANRNAAYPIQLRSPNEETTTRVKHRWKW